MAELDANKIIIELIKQFSIPVYEGTKKLGKESIDKLKVTLDLCFYEYLKRSYDRYSKTKTLLYRDAPAKLNDIYIRTDLQLNSDRIIKEKDFLKELEENRRIVVSGTAGSGKSTFCKSIFLEIIQNPRGILPIFIELRHLNSHKENKLIEFIIETMASIEPSFTQKQLEHALHLGKVLLILDGFDEINNENRNAFEKEIIALSIKHHKILIMLSSRPDTRFSSWEEFFHYRVLPLDKEKALSLVKKLDYDSQVKESFIKALDERLFQAHTSFASNPLLLTMMLLTYEQIAEIPNKIHLFYEQAFLTLFNKHDSLKSLYKRKSFCGLALDDFKKVLSTFCILSYSDKKYYFEEGRIYQYLTEAIKICESDANAESYLNDLLDSVCIMQRDGSGFTFTHRSFQEYFTALFLVSMARKNNYDIFEKIAFINDRDDVIPMVIDINSDLIEQEWIIPRLEKTVNELAHIPYTKEGKVIAASFLYEGLTSHDFYRTNNDTEEYTDGPTIAYQLKPEKNSNTYFMILLRKIYAKEASNYFEKNKTKQTKTKIEAERSLIKIDLGEENFLSLTDLESIKKSTMSKIIKSDCCDYALTSIKFCKHMLALLKSKQIEKDNNLAGLLLGSIEKNQH